MRESRSGVFVKRLQTAVKVAQKGVKNVSFLHNLLENVCFFAMRYVMILPIVYRHFDR